MPKSMLVIDDEPMILDAIKVIFEDLGYNVQTTSDSNLGDRCRDRSGFRPHRHGYANAIAQRRRGH